MTVEGEVILLFSAIFDTNLAYFVQSDNVYYVRSARLFSQYNDFNGIIKLLLPLQIMLSNLIVKEHSNTISESILLFNRILKFFYRKKLRQIG
jgi:hypothetical protein